jgi:hypothetical protein
MRPMAYLSRWIELLGLTVWIGGMVLLGSLVAPTVFNTVKPIEMAGAAMSLVLPIINGGLVCVCIALVVLFPGKFFLTASDPFPLDRRRPYRCHAILSSLYRGHSGAQDGRSPPYTDLRSIHSGSDRRV